MARTNVRGTQIKDGADGVDLAVDVTGVLPVPNGGTGNPSNTLGAVMIGGGAGALTAVAPGAAGTVLTSSGTAWSAQPVSGGGSDTFAFFMGG